MSSDNLVAPAVVGKQAIVLIGPLSLSGPGSGVLSFGKLQRVCRLGHRYLLAPGDETRHPFGTSQPASVVANHNGRPRRGQSLDGSARPPYPSGTKQAWKPRCTGASRGNTATGPTKRLAPLSGSIYTG